MRLRFDFGLASALISLWAFSNHGNAADCGTYLVDRNQEPEMQYECLRRYKSEGRLSRLSTDTLVESMQMLYARAVTDGRSVDADSMRIVVDELDARPHLGISEAGALYSALLSVGRLDESDALIRTGRYRAAGPVIARVPLPAAPMHGEVRYWTVPQRGEAKMEERSMKLDRGAWVIVYTVPGCGPCEVATRAILADSALRAAFTERSLWVHVPSKNHSVDFYDSGRHPEFPLRLVLNRNGWTLPDEMVAPTFVFLKDGQVAATEIGWPQGQSDKVSTHLREIGLLSAAVESAR